MFLNKVIIAGNLTNHPELRRLPSNDTPVVTFGVATNRAWSVSNGNKQEEVEFHTIVVFGKQAELIVQYLKKGQLVLVEGRLRTRSWEDANVKHYRTEIIAQHVQFGPKGKADETPVDSSPDTTETAEALAREDVEAF